MLSIEQTVAPTEEPVTLAVAKNYLKQTTTTDDALITSMIKAARQAAEKEASKAFVTQTFAMYLDTFPSYNQPIWLINAPVQSITSITHEDAAGATQTWSSSLYQLDNKQDPARLQPAYNQQYPDHRVNQNSITITYVSGYGAASAVPEGYVTAILMMVKHMYDNRTIATGNMTKELVRSVGYLLNQDKVTVF